MCYNNLEERIIMDNEFSGFVNDVLKKGDRYSYFFDGKLFHLNRTESVSGVEYVLARQQFPMLKTIKNNGGNVVLFDCVQWPLIFTNDELEIKPSYIFESKFSNVSFEEFSGIVCYGEWINKLFPPSQIVEYDSLNYKHNKDAFNISVKDGSKTIKLKRWKDVDKKFKYLDHGEEVEISFNISTPGTIMPEDENLGEIKSLFEIKFSRPHNISELKDKYLVIRKFFQFLVNRQDVTFDEIHVLRSCGDGYERIGYFYDLVNKSSEIPKQTHEVKYYFSNIAKLFKYISNEKVNFNYIHKNNEESRYITPEKYVNCCGAFEYNYKKVFKNEQIGEKTQEVVDDLNKFINSKNYNKKQRNIIKKLIIDIKNNSQSVEKEYNNCISRYKNALAPLFNELSERYKVAKTPTKLGSHFSSLRNLKAHGELEPFTEESICAYIVANAIIECLILDACGYGNDALKDIISHKY